MLEIDPALDAALDLLFTRPELVGPPKPILHFTRGREALRYESCDGFFANGDPIYSYVPYTPVKLERFIMADFPDLDEFEDF